MGSHIIVNVYMIGYFVYYHTFLTPVRSNLVYKFRYALCVTEYVGSTVRVFHTKVAEHRGTTLPQSNIRVRALSCNIQGSIDRFLLLANNNNLVNVRILEPFFICKMKPILTERQCFSIKYSS